MYYNKVIDQPLTLVNKSVLLGATSDGEEMIAGAIQTLNGQKLFIIEFEIDDDKDSPRIDFLVKFNTGEYVAIEVNGYQHFSLTSFGQDMNRYRGQWLRYFRKMKCGQRSNIPTIHINSLFDTKNNSKAFREALYKFISDGTFQKVVNKALLTKTDVSVNIVSAKYPYIHFDTIRYESGLPDMASNERVKNVVLGQGPLYKQNCVTIVI